MPYKFKPRTGYFMPANFGPLSSQRVCHYGDVTQLTILYLTDKDALAAYLPEPYEPADEPIVTVYCQVFRDVDFLAGRGYNVVGVNLAAVFNGKKDNFIGNYAAVLWENDTIPIITGRELLGAPKLYADIPDPRKKGTTGFFTALYMEPNLSKEKSETPPLLMIQPANRLSRLRGSTCGWAGSIFPKQIGEATK